MRCRSLKRLAWALPATLLWVSTLAAADTLRIPSARAVEVLPAASVPMAELSGLAWDASTQTLYAVSDRGSLIALRVERAGDDIRRLVPVSSVPIHGPDRADREPMDAEGLVLLQGGHAGPQFLVASEREQRIWRIDATGLILGEQPLAPTLPRQPSDRSGRNKGLESVAATVDGDVIVAVEDTAEPGIHVAHGARRQWRWRAVNGAKTRVKDMVASHEGALVWLEREDTRTEGTRVHVRSLEPSGCAEHSLCTVTEIGVLPRFGGNGNFEGLTQLGPGLWLAVSDERGTSGHRTVFVLFRAL